MVDVVEIRRRALKALVPPARLSLPDWIEEEIRLPEGVSATPGRVRLWPPQRGIAEANGDLAIERVTIVKPVRVGFTTLLTAALASYVANEPSPILLLLPTEADCRDYVVSDLEPTFEATPALRGMLADDGDRNARNTLMSRRFAGGSLKVIAAKSPRNLRRHTVRILLIDEADAMEVGAEGSPITLAERRTLSFGDRKIVLGSTPTREETSNVLRSYAQSDRRVFEVPCPECGDFHEIKWADIRWPEGRPDEAFHACPACGSVIDERLKPAMIEGGRWRATAAGAPGHAGFRLNALVSTLPNAAWGKLAAEFVEAKRSPDTLQVFVNTILAEGWRDAADEIDESEIASRAEPIGLDAIPEPVLVLTAGVDVQRDRLEAVILGWSRDEVFVLRNAVFWGDPTDDDVWAELDGLRRSVWRHPRGGEIRLDAVGIDAGDGATMDRVLAYTQPRLGQRVFAMKGAAGQRPVAAPSKIKKARLFIVGVDGVKQQIMNRITRGRSMRFSEELEPRFFEELASERFVQRYVKGAPVKFWERIPGRRAECLDSTVYGWAARHLAQIDLTRREDELAGIAAPPQAQSLIRSNWMGGR